LQIADKSMGEQSNILDTIKSKLVQANTDTTSDAGRESIRKDVSKLLTQLDNIAAQTNYNGKSLLADVKDGKLTGKEASALNFQIGANNTNIISTASINSTTASLGGGSNTKISEIKENSTTTLKNVTGGTLSLEAVDMMLVLFAPIWKFNAEASFPVNLPSLTSANNDLPL
jgi:flagellin